MSVIYDPAELRADLHEMPELAMQEVRTAAYAAEKLEALGLKVERGVGGTTGLTEPDLDALQELGRELPVIWTANYSTGIAVFRRMLHDYAGVLAGWDKEIVEIHHNQKADAPSGTAKLLLQELDPEGAATVLHGREGLCGKRKPEEIGVFSLRGGTVAGEHTVYFFGEDETLQITHRAASRRIFAAGALRAAQAICGRGPGFYTLDELLFEI